MLRFLHDGFVASGLDDPPLMEGQGAEAAAAVAAPVADEAVFDFLDGRNTAQRLVGGMVGAHIGQGVYAVHFVCAQRLGGGILHDQNAVVIFLRQAFPAEGIGVLILDIKAFCII